MEQSPTDGGSLGASPDLVPFERPPADTNTTLVAGRDRVEPARVTKIQMLALLWKELGTLDEMELQAAGVEPQDLCPRFAQQFQTGWGSGSDGHFQEEQPKANQGATGAAANDGSGGVDSPRGQENAMVEHNLSAGNVTPPAQQQQTSSSSSRSRAQNAQDAAEDTEMGDGAACNTEGMRIIDNVQRIPQQTSAIISDMAEFAAATHVERETVREGMFAQRAIERANAAATDQATQEFLDQPERAEGVTYTMIPFVHRPPPETTTTGPDSDADSARPRIPDDIGQLRQRMSEDRRRPPQAARPPQGRRDVEDQEESSGISVSSSDDMEGYSNPDERPEDTANAPGRTYAYPTELDEQDEL